MKHQDDVGELRERRSNLLQKREWESLRAAHGDGLAEALSSVVRSPVLLKDFSMNALPPYSVSWSGRLEDSPGLVAAYLSRDDVKRIVACIDVKLSAIGGLVGVYGNNYLGLCDAPEVSISAMLEAAEKINDSVVLYPKELGGALIIDCYSSNPGPSFSVLVQGDLLMNRLEMCFG